jgi:hypothetical protein
MVPTLPIRILETRDTGLIIARSEHAKLLKAVYFVCQIEHRFCRKLKLNLIGCFFLILGYFLL